MREIGFSKEWPKLKQETFTTFRFPRKDKDWQMEEVVKVVYKPRTKERKVLGVARIIRKQPKDLNKRFNYYTGLGNFYQKNEADCVTPEEAENDGFTGRNGGGDTEKFLKFFQETYGYSRCRDEKINKLTLYWITMEAVK